MKIRSGFVSNSSSSSFVVEWKCNFTEEITYAIYKIFDYYGLDYDEEEHDIYLGGNANSDILQEQFAAVVEVLNSTIIENGVFKSKFFTTMLNDCDSFGSAPQKLLMALAVDDNECFELIKTGFEKY